MHRSMLLPTVKMLVLALHLTHLVISMIQLFGRYPPPSSHQWCHHLCIFCTTPAILNGLTSHLTVTLWCVVTQYPICLPITCNKDSSSSKSVQLDMRCFELLTFCITPKHLLFINSVPQKLLILMKPCSHRTCSSFLSFFFTQFYLLPLYLVFILLVAVVITLHR